MPPPFIAVNCLIVINVQQTDTKITAHQSLFTSTNPTGLIYYFLENTKAPKTKVQHASLADYFLDLH